MSRLTTRPPVSVTVGGVEYPINTSFRNCLKSIAALDNTILSEWEKADIVVGNHFTGPIPRQEEWGEAVEQIVGYLTQFRKPSEDDKKPPVIDFEQDGQMIYDAFLSKGINLDEQNLSFWEFMAHLREPPRDCMLCRVVYLRQQLRRGKETKEERQECQRIGWDVINLRDEAAEQMDDYISMLYKELLEQEEVESWQTMPTPA